VAEDPPGLPRRASVREEPSQIDEPIMATTAVVAEPVESAEPTIRSAQEVAEEEGLTFAGTPGPGYSEGGNVYEPNASSAC
jgi:hypothetical protein